MNAKIKIRQCVIFIKSRKFDTADIKCFTVHKKLFEVNGISCISETFSPKRDNFCDFLFASLDERIFSQTLIYCLLSETIFSFKNQFSEISSSVEYIISLKTHFSPMLWCKIHGKRFCKIFTVVFIINDHDWPVPKKQVKGGVSIRPISWLNPIFL